MLDSWQFMLRQNKTIGYNAIHFSQFSHVKLTLVSQATSVNFTQPETVTAGNQGESPNICDVTGM